tara:strand:- start:499 stop:672 length:174 start_codon:yes stop_codon:yes gene_type:complete
MTENLRVYMINGSVVGLITFNQVENWLKLILLIVTIGFTASKWIKIEIDKKEKKEDE